jgi:hypothetical protein
MSISTMHTSRTVHSHDPLQPGYSYTLVEGEAQGFDSTFTPNLTPKHMLDMGVFGGNYFEGAVAEYPNDWFTEVKVLACGDQRFLGEKVTRKKDKIRFGRHYDESLNFFNVDASQSREEWSRKGWIHPDDPRGWFQWYCRYTMGRRHEDDARQIDRWRKMARHVMWLQNACSVGDLHCRPRQRQALLHWAYDSRKL